MYKYTIRQFYTIVKLNIIFFKMREIFDCVYRNRNFHFINEKKKMRKNFSRSEENSLNLFLIATFATSI